MNWSTAGTVKVSGVVSVTGSQATRPAHQCCCTAAAAGSRTWDRFAAELTAADRRAIAVDLRDLAAPPRRAALFSGVGPIQLLDRRDHTPRL